MFKKRNPFENVPETSKRSTVSIETDDTKDFETKILLISHEKNNKR